ncbi:hypothetical protein PRIPAC_95948 [Pristionchus pacificus]|uniref:Uncharacterized protein n=1 Tax=Pristionchus pacificus TaxID=54126 RepID=A0A2A6BJC3_PRIPA|nr:hypothetical protein PRIPAC_95948 [Pristionchus pacificus]|eukprot:PDM65999.1 hypothetical protein PRIPAC_44093 [Pristionchus pacificus]
MPTLCRSRDMDEHNLLYGEDGKLIEEENEEMMDEDELLRETPAVEEEAIHPVEKEAIKGVIEGAKHGIEVRERFTRSKTRKIENSKEPRDAIKRIRMKFDTARQNLKGREESKGSTAEAILEFEGIFDKERKLIEDDLLLLDGVLVANSTDQSNVEKWKSRYQECNEKLIAMSDEIEKAKNGSVEADKTSTVFDTLAELRSNYEALLEEKKNRETRDNTILATVGVESMEEVIDRATKGERRNFAAETSTKVLEQITSALDEVGHSNIATMVDEIFKLREVNDKQADVLDEIMESLNVIDMKDIMVSIQLSQKELKEKMKKLEIDLAKAEDLVEKRTRERNEAIAEHEQAKQALFEKERAADAALTKQREARAAMSAAFRGYNLNDARKQRKERDTDKLRYERLGNVGAQIVLKEMLSGRALTEYASIPDEYRSKPVRDCLEWLKEKCFGNSMFVEMDLEKKWRAMTVGGRKVDTVCNDIEYIVSKLHTDEHKQEDAKRVQFLLMYENNREYPELLKMMDEKKSYAEMKEHMRRAEYIERSLNQSRLENRGTSNSGRNRVSFNRRKPAYVRSENETRKESENGVDETPLMVQASRTGDVIIEDPLFVKRFRPVQGVIGGLQVEACLDTGAEVNLIDKRRVDLMNGVVVEENINFDICEALGKSVKTIGTVVVDVEMNVGRKCRVGFVVSESDIPTVLLGNGALEAMGLELNMKKEVLEPGDAVVSSQPDSAIVLKDVRIGPGRIGSVFVGGGRPGEGSKVLITDRVEVVEGTNDGSRDVQVPVWNSTDRDLVFNRDDTIGVWCKVEDIDGDMDEHNLLYGEDGKLIEEENEEMMDEDELLRETPAVEEEAIHPVEKEAIKGVIEGAKHGIEVRERFTRSKTRKIENSKEPRDAIKRIRMKFDTARQNLKGREESKGSTAEAILEFEGIFDKERKLIEDDLLLLDGVLVANSTDQSNVEKWKSRYQECNEKLIAMSDEIEKAKNGSVEADKTSTVFDTLAELRSNYEALLEEKKNRETRDNTILATVGVESMEEVIDRATKGERRNFAAETSTKVLEQITSALDEVGHSNIATMVDEIFKLREVNDKQADVLDEIMESLNVIDMKDIMVSIQLSQKELKEKMKKLEIDLAKAEDLVEKRTRERNEAIAEHEQAKQALFEKERAADAALTKQREARAAMSAAFRGYNLNDARKQRKERDTDKLRYERLGNVGAQIVLKEMLSGRALTEYASIPDEYRSKPVRDCLEWLKEKCFGNSMFVEMDLEKKWRAMTVGGRKVDTVCNDIEYIVSKLHTDEHKQEDAKRVQFLLMYENNREYPELLKMMDEKKSYAEMKEHMRRAEYIERSLNQSRLENRGTSNSGRNRVSFNRRKPAYVRSENETRKESENGVDETPLMVQASRTGDVIIEDPLFVKRFRPVQGVIGGLQVEACLDTGAEVNLIDKRRVDLMNGVVVEENINFDICEALGKSVKTIGTVVVDVEMNVGRKCRVGFVVSESDIPTVLLGNGALEAMGLELNMKKEVLEPGDAVVSSQPDSAIVLKDVRIGPGRIGSVFVGGGRPGEGSKVLITDRVEVVEGTNDGSRDVQVPVWNSTDRDLVFNRDDTIGVWCKVEDIDGVKKDEASEMKAIILGARLEILGAGLRSSVPFLEILGASVDIGLEGGV